MFCALILLYANEILLDSDFWARSFFFHFAVRHNEKLPNQFAQRNRRVKNEISQPRSKAWNETKPSVVIYRLAWFVYVYNVEGLFIKLIPSSGTLSSWWFQFNCFRAETSSWWPSLRFAQFFSHYIWTGVNKKSTLNLPKSARNANVIQCIWSAYLCLNP